MKILYIHNANMLARGANKIQVNEQVRALRCDLLAARNNAPYSLRSLWLFKGFVSLRKKYKYIYTRDLMCAYLIKTFFPEKTVVYEVHEFPNSKLWKALYTRTYNKIDRVVMITDKLRQDLPGFGIGCVLPDAVDLKQFDIKISKSKAREMLGLPKKKKIVMYVGGTANWKGIDVMKEAQKLVNMIQDDIIFAYITNVPHSEVPYYLKAADVLILPNSACSKTSREYTSPLKLFEYMASKRPIIASDLPSIREIVGDFDVTFFPADNPVLLADTIYNVLSTPRIYKNKTKNAFERVKDYTWEKRAKSIKNLYELEGCIRVDY